MKKTTIQVISFISGLTLAAVIIGVTITKNQAIRNEIENQINSVLKTTRNVVDAYKSIASKSTAAASFIKSDTGEKNTKKEAAEEETRAKLNKLWSAVETQAQGR